MTAPDSVKLAAETQRLQEWCQEHVAQFGWKAVTGKRKVVPVILGYRLSSSSFVLLLNRKDIFFESRDEKEVVRVYESLTLDEGSYIIAGAHGPVMGFAEHMQAIEAAKALARCEDYKDLCIFYYNRVLERIHNPDYVELVGTLADFFVPAR